MLINSSTFSLNMIRLAEILWPFYHCSWSIICMDIPIFLCGVVWCCCLLTMSPYFECPSFLHSVLSSARLSVRCTRVYPYLIRYSSSPLVGIELTFHRILLCFHYTSPMSDCDPNQLEDQRERPVIKWESELSSGKVSYQMGKWVIKYVSITHSLSS